MKMLSIMYPNNFNNITFYIVEYNRHILSIYRTSICENCENLCLKIWGHHLYNDDKYEGFKFACCLCRKDETKCFLCSLRRDQ